MRRFVIYDPKYDSYVKMKNGSWNNGFSVEEVNSYASRKDAEDDIKIFDSLSHCQVIEVIKIVEVVNVCNN